MSRPTIKEACLLVPRRSLPLVLVLALGSFACGEDEPGSFDPGILLQTSEDNVLANFQIAWRNKDIQGLTRLFATDYRFYLDPLTREGLGVEFWTRDQDSLATDRLFSSSEVKRIAVDLGWSHRSATSAGFVGPRATWTRLFITNVFLDVDYMPPGQELDTYRVEGQTQRFFFRRGRTNPPAGPGDTLVYIVEWHDDGLSAGLQSPSAVFPTTWSSLKALVLE